MSEFKNELAEALRKQRNLSASTIKTYTSLLNSLYKKLDGDGLEFFEKDKERILGHIKAMGSAQSRKTILSALFVLTGDKEYRENMIDDIKVVNESYRSQKTSAERKETLISFERVQEIHQELFTKMKANPSHTNIVNYIISSVCSGVYGVDLPPRRLEYADMKLRNFDKTVDNYLDKGKFVFNQYKTVKKHGTQVIPVPKDLNNVINKWKRLNPTEYLLVNDKGEKFTTSYLSKRIKDLFEGNSQDVLRSIFLSNYYKDMPQLKTMEDMAERMGHSVPSALGFYVKKDA